MTIRSTPFLFFFPYTATTEIYTLSLHDALPICWEPTRAGALFAQGGVSPDSLRVWGDRPLAARPLADVTLQLRSEEHTSELLSHSDLVCRLLLEKKNKTYGKVDN